jgi:hypothetical protein
MILVTIYLAFCLDKAQNAFSFGLSFACSLISRGLFASQNSQVMSAFPEKWNVASSLKTVLAVKYLSSSSLKRKSEQIV